MNQQPNGRVLITFFEVESLCLWQVRVTVDTFTQRISVPDEASA